MLRLQGEHDLTTVPSLRRLLEEAHQERKGVVLDIAETTFIDSSILVAMLDAHRQARRDGLGLALSTGGKTHPTVSRLLKITGLQSELQVCNSPEAAIASVREGLA